MFIFPDREFAKKNLKCITQEKFEVLKNKGYTRVVATMMVLGDRDLLVILAIFTIVMYGESSGS